MFDPKKFDEMAKKFTENLPEHLQVLKKDIEENFKASMQHTFSKMDLVTRQEFDVQTKVLAKTREKLEAVTEKLEQLEQSLKQDKE